MPCSLRLCLCMILIPLLNAAGQEQIIRTQKAAFRTATRDENELSIATDFPGGNGIVEKIEGDVVTLKPDLRGGRDWFYWSIECRTSSPRKLKFVLPDKKSMKYIGMQGPAISSDGGMTWDWLGADSVDGSTFECAFQPDQPLRLSVTIPYETMASYLLEGFL